MNWFREITFIERPNGQRELLYWHTKVKSVLIQEEIFDQIVDMSLENVKDLINKVLDNG